MNNLEQALANDALYPLGVFFGIGIFTCLIAIALFYPLFEAELNRYVVTSGLAIVFSIALAVIIAVSYFSQRNALDTKQYEIHRNGDYLNFTSKSQWLKDGSFYIDKETKDTFVVKVKGQTIEIPKDEIKK